jgi:hypothetical protein
MNIEKIISTVINIIIIATIIVFVSLYDVMGLYYLGILCIPTYFLLFFVQQVILKNVFNTRNKHLDYFFDYLISAISNGIWLAIILFFVVAG